MRIVLLRSKCRERWRPTYEASLFRYLLTIIKKTQNIDTMPDQVLSHPQDRSGPNTKIISLIIFVLGAVVILSVAGFWYLRDKQSPDSNETSTNSSSLNKKESLEFYAPAFVPEGYKIYESSLKDYFNYGPNYYEIVYIYGNNNSNDPFPFNITSFAKPSYFNPPTDCGWQRPDPSTRKGNHVEQKCRLVATLANGSDVFYAELLNDAGSVYYTKIDNTEITLGTGIGTSRALINEHDAIKVLNSLEKKSQ